MPDGCKTSYESTGTCCGIIRLCQTLETPFPTSKFHFRSVLVYFYRRNEVWDMPDGCKTSYESIGTCFGTIWLYQTLGAWIPTSKFQLWVNATLSQAMQHEWQHTHILFEIKVNTMTWRLQSVGWGLSHRAEVAQDNINISVCKLQRTPNYIKFVSDAFQWYANDTAWHKIA